MTIKGIKRITAHAPCVNFVTAIMVSTTEANCRAYWQADQYRQHPPELRISSDCQAGTFCLVINCAPVSTGSSAMEILFFDTASLLRRPFVVAASAPPYLLRDSGKRKKTRRARRAEATDCSSPLETTIISTQANKDKIKTPFWEKTRRSPLVASCLGKNLIRGKEDLLIAESQQTMCWRRERESAGRGRLQMQAGTPTPNVWRPMAETKVSSTVLLDERWRL